jgi:hypothetical protein
MTVRTLLLSLLACAPLLSPAAHPSPRALLIGVGDVPNNALPAIDLDIDNMKKVAAVMGYGPADIKVLFNQQATYANVQRALATWVRDGVGPDDHVLIYFSGHGTRVPDPTPANVGGVDDALVLHDVTRARIGGRATLKNVLIGHELGAALAAIPSHDVLVLVDACHSGTATRTLTLGNRRLGVGSGYMKFYSYPTRRWLRPAMTSSRSARSRGGSSRSESSMPSRTPRATGGIRALPICERRRRHTSPRTPTSSRDTIRWPTATSVSSAASST